MDSGNLIVGFELIDFEAVVEVNITSTYMVFTLKDFIVKPDSFGLGVIPMLPPVYEFRLVQLPVAPRERFGEWLNVMWDDDVAVNVLATCPYPLISSEKRRFNTRKDVKKSLITFATFSQTQRFTVQSSHQNLPISDFHF